MSKSEKSKTETPSNLEIEEPEMEEIKQELSENGDEYDIDINSPMVDENDNNNNKLDINKPRYIIPKIISCNDSYEDQTPDNLFKNNDEIWNAGHLSGWDVDNYIIFDFEKKVRITKIELRTCGDLIHDAKQFELQTADQLRGPWRTIYENSVKGGITSWQEYILGGVSRYWKLNIPERYSRHQVYLMGLKFLVSYELGRFEHLTNVEREYLRRSKRKDVYPNENIGIIQTNNVADLGQLTALQFIEWMSKNPKGVVGLPTGKTPELFIKWITYYKENWNTEKVKNELHSFGIKCNQFPSTNDMIFAQLDEFFPIKPTQHNSFLYYINKYYQPVLKFQEKNMLVFNWENLKIFKEHDMFKIFKDGKVNLSILKKKAKNDNELLQQRALMEVEQYCNEYEKQLRKLGGYGFILGGIGHDGHIAFNLRGSDPKLGTRLITLNYETAAQQAGDFGGISNTRGKVCVTIGLATFTYNKNATVIIIAAGEKKAKVVRDAIMKPQNKLRPASVLQDLPGARFYLTLGSSVYLTDRITEDIQYGCRKGKISSETIYQSVIELALELNKQIKHLTNEDLLDNIRNNPIYCYYAKLGKPLSDLKKEVCNYLIRMIDKGVTLPGELKILHTSPHHDDIMLAYHEIIEFLEKYNENHFTYVTSGFTSVSNKYVVSVLRKINLNDENDLNKYVIPIFENKLHLENICQKFKAGYELFIDQYISDSEILFVLRSIKRVYQPKSLKLFIKQIQYLLNEYFPTRLPGQKDDEKVQLLKGVIRESECDRLWALNNVNPKTHITHLRSKFYKGDYFNPLPNIKDDALPMLSLLEKINPDLISVAFDPEGTGPDTHYKVLQILAQALRIAREKKKDMNPKIWGYRNVWHRFQFSETTLAIPVSAKQLNTMHRAFLLSFGSQKKAEFPSPEYDGPFSVLSQRFHVQQLKELRILLGNDYFDKHWHPKIQKADGIILLKEMQVDEFLKHAQDLRSRIEIHKKQLK